MISNRLNSCARNRLADLLGSSYSQRSSRFMAELRVSGYQKLSLAQDALYGDILW